ncbi:MAG: ATP-binding protein, partial [Bryobacteraceae bacterium]
MSALPIELPLRADESAVVPPLPETLEETGLSSALLEQLLLKHLYYRGEILGRELAASVGLKFSLLENIVEMFKRQHLIGVKRSLGIGNMSSVFALTESGRNLAREYLDVNQYAGPAPVPLYQYAELVRRQKRKESWLTPEALREAFRHLVVSEDILLRIGPAVNASKSFLIYGQPGNGKTALAESLFRIDDAPIFIPYALEFQGKIVQMFDPIYHQKIEDQESEISAVSVDRT